MSVGSDLGATLGVRLAQIGSRVRETSLARTTPALVQQASAIADQMAGRRAEAVRAQLVDWLRGHGVEVPESGELSGLLGGITKAGGWLAQNVIGTAIGFGVGQSLSAVLNPYFTGLVQSAWRSNPNQVLSPAELALAVLRGNMDEAAAADEARSSGIDEARFRVMIDNTGEPPAPGDLLALWRRGVIDDATLERAIRQSRIRPEWVDTIKRMAVQWPSWSELLDAYLEGQVDEAEARRLYERAGGDPELFDLLFHTRGQAPTPSELLDLLNRGIIGERGTGPDATTYEQGFLEGPWRNKWLEPFLALRTYIVPPRSVVPMVRAGAWDVSRGVEELTKSGVPPDVAQAMLEEAVSGKLATEKDFVKADVLAAYRDGLMDQGAATSALEQMGYSADEAALILAIEDHRWEQSFRSAAINRIHQLYVAAKITEDEASSALASLGAGGTAASKYLALWDIERTLPRAELTEAQMRAAAKAGVVTVDEYQRWLIDHGYSHQEAQILIQTYKLGPTGG
ncbi:MAG TPA: hypothetical protein VFA66_10225 [Gaiellaceae bacterium]|nr:hypothetical protein [Gaiellaceae bacterium]